jgi:hypothetical protein
MFQKKEFVPPPMTLHQTGQARVQWEGESFYLGKYGSAAAFKAYQRLLPHLEERFYAKKAGVPQPVREGELTIDEGLLRWFAFLTTNEAGDLLPDGTLSSHFQKVKWHTRPLSELYGDQSPEAFTAQKLSELRGTMRTGKWREKPKPKKWAVSYANAAVKSIIEFFAWLEANGLVAPGKREHLMSIKPLRHELVQERGVVSDAAVETVCKYTSPTVAAIIKLQRLSAARPSEILRMTPGEIDRSRAVWVYSPRRHKTAWHGIVRQIPLGEKCQEILTPFLEKCQPDEFLFKPSDTKEWHRSRRLGKQKPDRTTPIYPSELKRRKKLIDQRRIKRVSKPRDMSGYNRQTYYKAVKYAIKKAKKAGEQMSDWFPYMLRHTRITEVQQKYGWEEAAAFAGHASPSTTKQYSHQRKARALELASKIPS